MSVDPSQWRIETPTNGRVTALYRALGDIFPADRAVFDDMAAHGRRYYTLTPHVLYAGKEFLGHVGLMPMRVWLENQAFELIGIGAVATSPRHRHKGVASHLLTHCLDLIDQQKKPAVLFTNQPDLYQRHGFRPIEQIYRVAKARAMPFAAGGYDLRWVDQLAPRHLQQMARLRAERYPHYDGTLVRDAEYWKCYEMLVNRYPTHKVLACHDGDAITGYARVDVEGDRLLVPEFCVAPADTALAEALLHHVADYALSVGRRLVSFGLPRDHFLADLLQQAGVLLDPEKRNVRRQLFMARPAAGESLAPLERLQWSLADKF